MSNLDQLAERIKGAIPLTRHLGFQLLEHQPGELVLSAPLAPNTNDKGTFFAGSQATLLTLGGWALSTLEGESLVSAVDVVAAESHLRYLAPLSGDARIQILATADDRTVFARRLQRRGRARLAITATLHGPDGILASRFEAQYLVRDLTPDADVID